MFRSIAAVFFCLSLALLPACGGAEDGDASSADAADENGKEKQAEPKTREQTVNQLMDKMDRFPEILAEVEDKASAQAASAKLEELAESIKPLIEKWESFGEMTGDEAASMESKFKARAAAFEDEIKEQMTRITSLDPTLLPVIQQGMTALKDAMKDFDIDG
ncbi:MAG: hypothetical protein ACE37H_13755 [Phycisphaeraceae bacterium]